MERCAMRPICNMLAAAACAIACATTMAVAEEAGVIAPVVGGDEHHPFATTETFPSQLALCQRNRVSNAPAADENGFVQDYARVVNVSGVALAVDPAPGACLSSGFGRRHGHFHKGLDLYSRVRSPIM